jgi:putative addiction module component (TIGR02574 family)
MSTAADVFAQALAMPSSDRAALAQQLLESLQPAGLDDEDAWTQEIQARSDALHRGELPVCDWEQAIENVRSQLSRRRQP